AGLADRCEVQLSYAIGVARPISIMVDTFNTARVPEEKIVELINKHFDLRHAEIIKNFDLKRPLYLQVAKYGHFGRNDLELPWEEIDKAEILKNEAFSR
ncbi:MAG: methionine adenosyltransferase domain-containing protein, partial [Bacillota bacterium]|nr:methionine adenosyltransferase domain-containing protein [Bacillota bacterium]